MEYIVNFLLFLNMPQKYALVLGGTITMILFSALLCAVSFAFTKASRKYFYSPYFKLNNKKWENAVRETNFFAVLGYLGAGFMAKLGLDFFFSPSYQAFNLAAEKIITAYFQICILITANKALNAAVIINRENPSVPIKGITQFIKIFINFFGSLIILAYFIGKEPTYFISALGVIASVLMIVFKDTILGFTASWQLAMNNMLHIGDWIESPKHNADGIVIDISLTTVSVRNWDNTIIAIPAYDLTANAFQNWRGMSDSGGRRIKRALYIDMQSVKFLDQALFERLKKIELLKDYLEEKNEEIKKYNSGRDTGSSIINGRHLSNAGVFRAYCLAYIKTRPYISKNFTAMVRQLDITAQGLPLEIYCFTATTQWEAYEGYQSDIFDHLLSAMKEFDLYVFQNPSGRDFANLKKQDK
ncbi:MAG: mechanosensitive ion channel family protein [Endomicrobium sp.]|jgi:miniconductance mechanosensitive channel|nr:mechanosensitive ion channel family protein [Endomicrobium sp.]